MDPDKIKAINDWPVPKDVTGIQSFMGITGYYRRFIEGFSRIAYPITSLQKKLIPFHIVHLLSTVIKQISKV